MSEKTYNIKEHVFNELLQIVNADDKYIEIKRLIYDLLEKELLNYYKQ